MKKKKQQRFGSEQVLRLLLEYFLIKIMREYSLSEANDEGTTINADIKKDGDSVHISLNGLNIKVNGGGKNIKKKPKSQMGFQLLLVGGQNFDHLHNILYNIKGLQQPSCLPRSLPC